MTLIPSLLCAPLPLSNDNPRLPLTPAILAAEILAAKMMLEWLGEKEKARRIEQAVAEVVARGEVRTYDMGGSAATSDVARAVVRALRPARVPAA